MKLNEMWGIDRAKPAPTYRPQAVTTPSMGISDGNRLPGYGNAAPAAAPARPPASAFHQWMQSRPPEAMNRQGEPGLGFGVPSPQQRGHHFFRDFLMGQFHDSQTQNNAVLPHEQGPQAVPGMNPVDSMPWLKKGRMGFGDGRPGFNTGIVPPNFNGGQLPNEQAPPAVSSYQGTPPPWW